MRFLKIILSSFRTFLPSNTYLSDNQQCLFPASESNFADFNIANIKKRIIMLRDKLVEIALQWQAKYGVAPQITPVISEYDAAMLVGMSESDYSDYMQDKTAVSKGADFVFNHQRYQIKANRPSGKPGSKVTKVPKATNYLWDKLIWILYDQHYVMQEAWEWDVENYKSSNPQPIGFRGNLLVKRQKFFYCTYSLGITETS